VNCVTLLSCNVIICIVSRWPSLRTPVFRARFFTEIDINRGIPCSIAEIADITIFVIFFSF